MKTVLPHTVEPTDTKRTYNALAPDVREASLRQSSDFSQDVYRAWKAPLNSKGVTWQMFLAASSGNREAWRRWLDDEGTWIQALASLTDKLNACQPGARLELAAIVVG